MKLPNGYGSVYRLSGNRRKPYVARITQGWKDNGQPQYRFLGYFSTKEEALRCLAEYNHVPYDIDMSKLTLADVFQRWYESSHLSPNTLKNRKSAYSKLKPLYDMQYSRLKVYHIQDIINAQTSTPPQRSIKNLMHNLDNYAITHDITSKRIADILSTDSYTPSEKTIFSHDEIERIKSVGNMTADFILIMLYSGIRISELFQITTDDCRQGYFVCGVKTKAGKKRIIPIHHEIMPIVDKYLDGEMLASFTKTQFRAMFDKLMNELGMHHVPHETRHSFRTALDETDANRVSINFLMGHVSKDIGERIYTHKTMQDLKETIEKLTY